MNIYQRINEVRKEVEKIRKDKKVEGYMAVTHDAVTALTRQHLIDQSIVIVPAGITKSATQNTGTFTSRGTPFVRFEATYRFDVVNAEDPSDKFTAEIDAHALDHGDKAPGKALSYAKKALMLKLLEIESFEGEENREEQHKPKNTPTQQTRDAFDSLTPQQKKVITDTSTQIIDYLNENRDWDAYALCETVDDPEEKMGLWSLLSSSQRSRIKKQSEESKKKAS